MEIFARRQAEQAEVERRLREEYGVFINFVSPVEWQGRRVRALGQRLWPTRPPSETFSEFILHVLRGALGADWWYEQQARPPEQRHFLARCFDEYDAWRAANATPENAAGEGLFNAPPNGWTLYLTSLAWDVASLFHVGALPAELVGRLRNDDQFQGARYEVAIGGVFARLNCEIAWQEPGEQGEARVEFVVTHRPTGATVAVEAKSRHRAGVLNQPGDRPEDLLQRDRSAVRRLFIRALRKRPAEPFLIFLDINAPVTLDQGDMPRWQLEVLRWMERLRGVPDSLPGPFAALFVTNFSPHYSEGDIVRGHEWLVVPSDDPPPLPAAFGDALELALRGYANIPEFIEDGRIA